MIAFDRDGVLVGVLGDFEANHPKHINGHEMNLIMPVVEKINSPCICISNQQGIKWGYISKELVILQFGWLMGKIPQIQASFFCPDAGESCIAIVEGKVKEFEGKEFRKPDSGMAELAKSLGFPITHYVGDLSGNPNYADGRDSDLQFAKNSGLQYLDVNEFLMR